MATLLRKSTRVLFPTTRSFSGSGSGYRAHALPANEFLDEPAEDLLDFRPEKYRMINVMPRPPITLYASPEERLTTNDLFGGEKRVVVFGIPSPFSEQRMGASKDYISERLPTFLTAVPNIFERDVDSIVCISMNDPWVQKRWNDDLHLVGDILMLTDHSSDFTRQIGMDVDLSAVGQGIHTRRYNMIVDNGRVMFFNVEKDVHVIQRTSSVILLEQLDVLRRDIKRRRFVSSDWTHDSLKQELMSGEFESTTPEDTERKKEKTPTY